jgi:hypothetical protein
MWSSLLALALVGMLNPIRLGVTLLVTSQPRPLQKLLAYWLGSLTVGIPALLVPLAIVHASPTLSSFAAQWATPTTSPPARWVQVGLGVAAVGAAALLIANARTRQHSSVPNVARPPVDPAPERRTVRRLLGRAHWDNGSVWASWAIGLFMGPAPDVVVFALAIIVASGAALGTQLIAAVVYVVGVLAVVEIILISHLLDPSKTQAALRVLHGWTSARRRQLLVAILAVVGVSMLVHGSGVL